MENQHINTYIKDVDMSKRLRNCFVEQGFDTLGDIAARTRAELLRIPNFGSGSLRETEEILELFDLHLHETMKPSLRKKQRKWFIAQWLPIATAPKDGTEILASQGDYIDVVAWSEKPYGFFEANGIEMHPNHWMRLPWPPEPH